MSAWQTGNQSWPPLATDHGHVAAHWGGTWERSWAFRSTKLWVFASTLFLFRRRVGVDLVTTE